MANDWPEFSLGELCSLITDGKHGDCENEANSGFYFLSVKDVLDGRLVYDNARQIAERDFLETHRRTNLEPGDILFTNTGTIGRMAIARDEPKTYRTTFQKSVAILKPRRDLIDPHFLYYLLHFDNDKLSDFAAGTTQKNLLLKDFRSFAVRVPSLREQRAIAHILGTLDDKIELNRRMNETLEAMARAIFKSWFVDFDPVRAKAEGRNPGLPTSIADLFPDSFEDSELGKIPKGWRLCKVGDLGRITTGKTPSTKIEGNFGGELPFLTPSDMDSRIAISSTGRYLSKQGGESVRSARIPAGAIAVSCIGSDMGKVVITGRESVTNQQINSITVDNTSHREYLLFNLRDRKDEIRSLGSGGSAVPILNKAAFSRLTVLRPHQAILEAYHCLVCPMLSLIAFNIREAEELATLRDTLLPKLLSGEIRVNEADKADQTFL
jgi:type I restriction enzyme S subunit